MMINHLANATSSVTPGSSRLALSLPSWGAAVLLLLSAGCATSASTPAASSADQPSATTSALAYYVQGCDAGDASACANAGRVLTDPASTYHDDLLLVTLRTRACDGNAYYCGELGQMYYSGKDVQKNEEKGLTLLDRACAAKNKPACSSASAAKEQAKGAQADKSRATAAIVAPERAAAQAKDSAVAVERAEPKKVDAPKPARKSPAKRK
jgi:TPR repeat protein